jgi:siroheme synthase (precorrin-2 oxidase/ferrochelatase)
MRKLRQELETLIDSSLEKVLNEHLERIDRIDRFLPKRNKIDQVLNDDFLTRVTSHFEQLISEGKRDLEKKFLA